jgi:AraC-like DNA-binding protein
VRPHFLRADELRVIIGQQGFCVKALAAHLGLEVRTLARRFGEHFGMSPGMWIMRERIALAPPLLTGGSSNKEVARSLGYTCESSFIRAFKRYFGRTPQQFVRLHVEGSRRSGLEGELWRSAKDAELSRLAPAEIPAPRLPWPPQAFALRAKSTELLGAAVDEPHPVRFQAFE